MPEFKDMLKYFRMRENLSQSELAEKLGMSASRISMYEVGKREPDFETEEKIADFFNTDLNTLRGRDVESDSFIAGKAEKDISKILENTREQLLTQEGLMFDGEPASEEAIDSILSAMQIGMEMAKKKNKEKYTPKKYRKD